ncbi:MAG: serine/threonine protein kinase, partial [Deltaproteobacteria bacterium]|nr:serine/threonine protein kinase [Deltaproteobacteria bacterium]
MSLFVGGARVRCARCHMRFEVMRPADPPRKKTPAPPVAGQPNLNAPNGPNGPTGMDPLLAEQKTVPSDRIAQERNQRLDASWQVPAEKPAAAPATTTQRAPAPPPAPFPQLEGFAVHERLGQGGMGEVFRCTNLKDGRPVAVKVLGASLAVVPDYVKRFEREAAAMAQLDHPGVVRLTSRGRSGPHCWISMELIDGASLRTWAHQNRPTPRTLARLLAQVAHALAYAHARGVVHRDLKPDNVLVQNDGKTKVLDFGLAGLYVQGAECLTQSNVAMGT